MLFNSFQFLLFFPIVTILYFLLPHKLRWVHLLLASCIFYMTFVPIYILILIGTIIVDYIAGIMIERAPASRKKPFLVMSIIANVGVLAFFKYFNFFAENINTVSHYTNSATNIPLLTILLPIGLSFHTFQAMSYTVEVYRGNQKAERHFGIYALYVMFYPQLVAGPIERPQNMIHQFYERHEFSYTDLKEGLQIMLWGFFKKIVIADRLSLIVNNVYNAPMDHSGVSLTIASILFTFQLYCDFSGYSDIALGAARVMGFQLMVNFNRPFSSKSVTEFWRRWHISLSTWFYDYVFNPLVLSLRNWGKAAIVSGLLFTFFLSGFWHGAGWKFIVYGLLNGVALVYEYFTKKQRKKLFNKLPAAVNSILSKVLTLGYITFTWIFFRASSIHAAGYIIAHLHTGWSRIISVAGIKTILSEIGSNDILYGLFNLLIGVLLIIAMEFIQYRTKDTLLHKALNNSPRAVRWGFYYALIILLLTIGVYNHEEFIYFQF